MEKTQGKNTDVILWALMVLFLLCGACAIYETFIR